MGGEKEKTTASFTHDKLSFTHDKLSFTHDKLSFTHDKLSSVRGNCTILRARAVLPKMIPKSVTKHRGAFRDW